MCIFNADKRPITVAAQRWTRTSFHLYALASGLAGHLDEIKLFTFGLVARLYHILAKGGEPSSSAFVASCGIIAAVTVSRVVASSQ